MNRFAAILSILALAWTATVSGTALDARASLPTKPVYSGGYLPPCATEDATYNCYWDAQRQGNGQGTSFVVYRGQVYSLK